MGITAERVDAIIGKWSDPFVGEIFTYGANLDLQNGYAIKGNFDVSRSKYLIEPFKAVRNSKIREVVILKAVQTGGSLIADISVPYWIEHSPGDTLWLLQDDKFAETYMSGRFLPLLKRTQSIAHFVAAAGRFSVKKTELLLPHMTVMIGGLNEGNVQSFSWQNVIIDEAWMAKSSGLIRQAKARTGAYPHTRKVLIISQAGVEEDDMDLEWKKSNQCEWQWCCPSCGHYQSFEWTAKRDDGSWAGMKWDTNETTRPNGRWNLPEVGKTARLECFQCRHQIEDTPANRRTLDDTHRYEPTNPGADSTIVGFHWPAIASCDNSFAELVSKYLWAKEQDEQHGYKLPLTEFYQKDLARPWNLNSASDYHRIAHEPYDVASDWPEEAYRFLTVDCQKDLKEFWYVVRAWSATGESRQLARGRCESWDDIAEVQSQWRVKDQYVGIDVGYEQTRVAQECVKHGHVGIAGGRKMWFCWVALKGSPRETFTHRVVKVVNGKQSEVVEKRIYSPLEYLNPNIGIAAKGHVCPFFNWSNLHVKDILRRHRDGQARKFLCLEDTAPPTDVWGFTAQMNSECRRKERDENTGKLINIYQPVSKTRPNHWWDCEAMQITKALIHRVIGADQSEQVQPEEAKA